jgi:hypothetical protein
MRLHEMLETGSEAAREYKRLAKIFHPDLAGDKRSVFADLMTQLVNAKDSGDVTKIHFLYRKYGPKDDTPPLSDDIKKDPIFDRLQKEYASRPKTYSQSDKDEILRRAADAEDRKAREASNAEQYRQDKRKKNLDDEEAERVASERQRAAERNKEYPEYFHADWLKHPTTKLGSFLEKNKINHSFENTRDGMRFVIFTRSGVRRRIDITGHIYYHDLEKEVIDAFSQTNNTPDRQNIIDKYKERSVWIKENDFHDMAFVRGCTFEIEDGKTVLNLIIRGKNKKVVYNIREIQDMTRKQLYDEVSDKMRFV